MLRDVAKISCVLYANEFLLSREKPNSNKAIFTKKKSITKIYLKFIKAYGYFIVLPFVI